MRYRPFGAANMAISAVSIAMTDSPLMRSKADWRGLVYRALENGVNAFEIVGQNPTILEGLTEALDSIERHLIFVAKRLGPTPTGGSDFSPEGLSRTVEATLARTGLEYLDAVLLNDPSEAALSKEALEALTAMRDQGRTRQIGITGEGPAIDAYISSGKFDVLSMPYSLQSGWISRNRIRDAVDHNMAIMGYGFQPAAFVTPPGKSILPKRLMWGAGKKDDDANVDAYGFLHDTFGWTAEEICLAYALTQPALATVQLTAENAPRLAELAAIPERDMPPGLAPRIEMARFGNMPNQARA